MNILHKYLLLAILILACSTLTVGVLHGQSSSFTVVIDPGHGGKDLGTTGKHSIEKELVLAISKKVKQISSVVVPEITIVLTREADEFLKLRERSTIANQLNADLFLSLHCNHHDLTSVHGSELYVLGLESSNDNLRVVLRENFQEESDHQTEELYDETHIFSEMMQAGYLEESLLFASLVEFQLAKETSIKQRNIKQAGFSVLKKVSMPGALLESGYLSNAKDEKYLLSEEGQTAVALSIVQAIQKYYTEYTLSRDVLSTEHYQIMLKESKEEISHQLSEEWIHVKQFSVTESNGIYRYFTGNYTDFEVVQKERDFLISKGFTEATIILK